MGFGEQGRKVHKFRKVPLNTGGENPEPFARQGFRPFAPIGAEE